MKAIEIESSLLKKIRGKPAEERRRIGEAIAEAQRSFGSPHTHKRLGLRKLKDDYYEIRLGLDQRLVFENTANALLFEFVGNHDEVVAFLKSR